MAVSDDKRLAGLLHEALLNDDGFLKEMLRTSLQEFLEAEMTEHLGVAAHGRSNERRGYRNGFKPRQLRTRIGTLDLLVPQDREGTFQTELFERYQRSEKALVSALMQMYVEGVSTRKVKAVTEELCGTSFSKSRSEEHTSELQSRGHLVCRLLLEKKKNKLTKNTRVNRKQT